VRSDCRVAAQAVHVGTAERAPAAGHCEVARSSSKDNLQPYKSGRFTEILGSPGLSAFPIGRPPLSLPANSRPFGLMVDQRSMWSETPPQAFASSILLRSKAYDTSTS